MTAHKLNNHLTPTGIYAFHMKSPQQAVDAEEFFNFYYMDKEMRKRAPTMAYAALSCALDLVNQKKADPQADISILDRKLTNAETWETEKLFELQAKLYEARDSCMTQENGGTLADYEVSKNNLKRFSENHPSVWMYSIVKNNLLRPALGSIYEDRFSVQTHLHIADTLLMIKANAEDVRAKVMHNIRSEMDPNKIATPIVEAIVVDIINGWQRRRPAS
jgi:hypothetical protein